MEIALVSLVKDQELYRNLRDRRKENKYLYVEATSQKLGLIFILSFVFHQRIEHCASLFVK
jgi:hypothetical protein